MEQVAKFSMLGLLFGLVITAPSIFATGTSAAAVLVLTPTSDRYAEDSNLDGTFETLADELDPLLRTFLNPRVPVERRAALEFDLFDVTSSGASIRSATLTLTFTGLGIDPDNNPDGPVLRVHGYAGDGSVSLSDMTVFNLLATEGPFTSTGTINIDVTTFIRSLVNANENFAGFMLKTSPFGIVFRSANDSDANRHPRLTVDQVNTSVLVEDLIEAVADLDPDDFSNPNQQQALIEKLEEVLALIQAGDLLSICEAIEKLTNDILPKTDGETPPPDWVTNPSVQQQLQVQIIAIIEALQDDAEALGVCPSP